MKEFFKVLRLAFYVCALPLVATATVSAFQYLESNTGSSFLTDAAAASEAELKQDKHTTYVVRRSSDGVVTGRVVKINAETAKISGISGLSVQFAQDGNLVAKTTTDDQGNFAIGDMDSGTYSFFGISRDDFVAFAIRVVDDETENAADSLFVESAATSGMTERLKREIRSKRSSNRLKSMTLETRPEFTNLSGASRVELTSEGTLKGRAVSLYREGNDNLAGMTVRLYQGGKLVDETKTDANGNYAFYNIEDGVYDLFAYGKGGFAAFRFDAARSQMPVSTTAAVIETGLAPVQEFALTPFNDAVFVDEPVEDDGGVPVPLDGGVVSPTPGAPGGSFGGGVGGGPAFAGGGRLLWIPGLVLGVVALADNNNTTPPGPVSPIE